MLGLVARHGTRPAARYTSKRTLAAQVGLVEELEERNLLCQVTKRERLLKALTQHQTVYSRIDPTARSLHIGHLLPLLCLLRFQLRGHAIIPMIGGATAFIGDHTSQRERRMMHHHTAAQNATALTANLKTFFRRAATYAKSRLPSLENIPDPPTVANNLDWYGDMKLLEFLYLVGNDVRTDTMVAQDNIQLRLRSWQGLSFTEFSYQLLQAYDFYQLYKTKKCTVQIGADDQWDNIIAGIELVDYPGCRVPQDEAYGLTTPREKMGMAGDDVIWLDSRMTRPLDFFLHFLKTSDEDVGRDLKRLTFLPLDRIEQEMRGHAVASHADPGKRKAQQLLAGEITEMIHGEKVKERARLATSFLYGCDYTKVMAEDIIEAFRSDHRLIRREDGDLIGKPLSKLAAECKLAKSRTQANILIKRGELYLNNRWITETGAKMTRGDLIDDRLAILRRGSDTMVVLCRGRG